MPDTQPGPWITDSNIIQPKRGPLERWVSERCRWCWASCGVGRCECHLTDCDDQEAGRVDAPLFEKARTYDALMAEMAEALWKIADTDTSMMEPDYPFLLGFATATAKVALARYEEATK